MTIIKVPSSIIHNDRPKAVKRIISPLLPQRHRSTVQQMGKGRNQYSLGLLPFGRSANSFSNLEDALVPTNLAGFLLNYYETWVQSDRADEYYLERAYLHIFSSKGSVPKQILSLHCDPAMKLSEGHYRYRRGPHLHFAGVTPSVDRAHVSLCINDDHRGGADLSALTESFAEAIKMIATEFFPCWERAA
jgi:hypothetical protein